MTTRADITPAANTVPIALPSGKLDTGWLSGLLAQANTFTALQTFSAGLLADSGSGVMPTFTTLSNSIQAASANGAFTSATLRSFGVGSIFGAAATGGTRATPTGQSAGDALVSLQAYGYNSANAAYTGLVGDLTFSADEAFSTLNYRGGRFAMRLARQAAGGLNTVLYGIGTGEFGFGAMPAAGNGRVQFPNGTTRADGLWMGDFPIFRQASGVLGLGDGTTPVSTATTVGAAGGGAALPATPVGYLRVSLNGTVRKIPYYND